MVKWTHTYTDYNGDTRTEDFMFNITQAEAVEMQFSVPGGLSGFIEKIADSKDLPALIKLFKEFVLKTYGEKSSDGRRFVKSEELSKNFEHNPAFNDLYIKLATEDEFASKFINSLIPSNDGKFTIVTL